MLEKVKGKTSLVIFKNRGFRCRKSIPVGNPPTLNFACDPQKKINHRIHAWTLVTRIINNNDNISWCTSRRGFGKYQNECHKSGGSYGVQLQGILDKVPRISMANPECGSVGGVYHYPIIRGGYPQP